jgi:amino acid permease
LIIAIFANYPLQLFVVTDIGEEYLFTSGLLSTKHQFWKQNLFRTILVLFTGVIAVAIPNFNSLISLIGSFGSAALQFIFPGLIYLRLYRWKSGYFMRFFSVFIVVFGVGVGALGTGQTIQQIISDHGDSGGCKKAIQLLSWLGL